MAGTKSDQPSDKGSADQQGAWVVGQRKRQYLVAPQTRPGFQPMAMNVVEDSIRSNPNIEVVRTITHTGLVGALSAGPGTASSVLVVRMHQDHAAILQMQTAGQLHVEPDTPLSYTVPTPTETLSPINPGVLISTAARTSITIVVSGPNKAPVVGADVYLYGAMWPAQGVTDDQGRAILQLVGDTPSTVKALYVSPKSDYWNMYVTQPDLTPSADNIVNLKPLGQTIPQFPQQQTMGWGQRAMRLDHIPKEYRGQGIKIAIIDSGAATSHSDLNPTPMRGGYDTTAGNDHGWQHDEVGHGSHCAGIISGRANNDSGIVGFAPDAEVYVYKIFPGGRFSNLLEALNRCIEQQIDVINLSLGAPEVSLIVEQKLQQLRDLGIACIVAAGNSGGHVEFPASSAKVLGVAAMGRIGEFPDDSFHKMQILNGMDANGFFPAKFSCYGPEVDVCAPGVAIVSSVPPDNFAAWDGTSMAAPHVTGLAALVLGHHPDFQGQYRAKDSRRVERLFQILKSSAYPVNFGDPRRTGAGLPDAPRALNLDKSVPSAAIGGYSVAAALSQVGDLLHQVGILEPVTSGWIGLSTPRPTPPQRERDQDERVPGVKPMALASKAMKQAGLI